MRAVWIFLGLICGGMAAYLGQPLIRNNSDAVTIIITVMTVFAGFLVAVMTIVGDPALVPDGSWRVVENRRSNIENRLITYLWLFVFYLIAIALLFVGVLIDKAPTVSEAWKVWIERGYLFFSASSFFFTLGLPRALWKLQMARLEAELSRRRRSAGLED